MDILSADCMQVVIRSSLFTEEFSQGYYQVHSYYLLRHLRDFTRRILSNLLKIANAYELKFVHTEPPYLSGTLITLGNVGRSRIKVTAYADGVMISLRTRATLGVMKNVARSLQPRRSGRAAMYCKTLAVNGK